MRSAVLGAMLTALIVVCGASASAQVANGSFESGTSDPGDFWLTLDAGSNVIDSWTIDEGSIDYMGGWWQASDGVRSLDMSGLVPGKISQYVATVPGTSYKVSFDMSGNPDGEPLVKLITVTADGGQGQTFSYDISAFGNSRLNMGWARQQYTFVAQSDLTLLSFASGTDGFYGPTLDNVSMEAIVTTDPTFFTICHRNFGRHGLKTLVVNADDYVSHMSHGDKDGPCETE